MATSDPALKWFRDELGAIKSRRFHIFEPVGEKQLAYRHGGKQVALSGPYASFLREFGWAKLFTDYGDAPLVSAYPLSSRRRFKLSDGVYVGFGFRGEETALFSESDLFARGESAVFREAAGGSQRINDNFGEWLKVSYDRARSTFSARAWERICAGPKPFSRQQQRIVEARRKFTVRHTGFAKNGDATFSVRNDSDMTLPYYSLGVQGKGGTKLVGGVFLDVSSIPPGTEKSVRKDCYKESLRQDELEIFELPEPIPEKKEGYWEFKSMSNKK
jgi:hypothetical protein